MRSSYPPILDTLAQLLSATYEYGRLSALWGDQRPHHDPAAWTRLRVTQERMDELRAKVEEYIRVQGDDR